MNLVDSLYWITGAFKGALSWTPTANRSISLPDDSGTVLLDDRPIGSAGAGVSVRGYLPIVTVSGSKTLALSDANTTQICTATATITIPANLTVAYPIGTEITITRNTSSTVTLALAGGVAVNTNLGAANTLTTIAYYVMLKKTGTDTWVVNNPIPNNVVLTGDAVATTQTVSNNSTRIATTAFVKNTVGIMPSFSNVGVSSDKTLALTDANTAQICTAITTITIPANTTVAFAIGTEISILRNTAATVTLALSAGVTATDRNGNTNTLTQVTNYTRLKKVGTDAWIVINPVPNNFNLPGNPTCNTQAPGTNNTTLSTTAFVQDAVAIAGSVVNPTNTSIIDWTIPAGVRRITLLSGGLYVPPYSVVRLGTSGGIVTAGYNNAGGAVGSTAGASPVVTDAYLVPDTLDSTGSFWMTLWRVSANRWIMTSQSVYNPTILLTISGNVQLPGELTTLRYVSGVMNGGSLQLLWEY